MWAQINLEVPKRAGIYMSHKSTNSFSKLTDLHEVTFRFNIETLNIMIFSHCYKLQAPCDRQYSMSMMFVHDEL
jgi:hypothetical protein